MADEVGKPRNDGAEPRGLHGPGDTAEPDELAVDPGVADPTVELPDEERDEKAADEPQPARECLLKRRGPEREDRRRKEQRFLAQLDQTLDGDAYPEVQDVEAVGGRAQQRTEKKLTDPEEDRADFGLHEDGMGFLGLARVNPSFWETVHSTWRRENVNTRSLIPALPVCKVFSPSGTPCFH